MIWLFFFLFGLFQARPAEALTLSDLLTRTRVYLKDTNASRPKFSDAQLTSFLNDSMQEANLRAFSVVATTQFALVNGTTEYSLPSTSIIVLRVTVNHVMIPERTFSFLDDQGTAWLTVSTGTVQDYYIRTSSSIVAGVSKESIGFHPESASGVAHVDFLAQPTDMAVGSDVPFGSDNKRLYPFHHILAYRAAYMGYLAIGDMDAAIIYFKDYESQVPMLESASKTRMMYNPNFRGQPNVQQAPATAGQQ